MPYQAVLVETEEHFLELARSIGAGLSNQTNKAPNKSGIAASNRL